MRAKARFLILIAGLASAVHAATIDLSGTWGFKLDPNNSGIKEHFYMATLPQQINLPGSLQEQGYGNDISVETEWTGSIHDRSWYKSDSYAPYRKKDNMKIPFWLQPPKHYVGVAWYQRDVEIPANWKNKRISLFFERCHWETQVWVDKKKIGSNNSLVSPHEYDLTNVLTPGKHRITIRVNNQMIMNVGINAHSVSDHTQGNWNGIVGKIEVRASEPVWIDDIQVYPSAAKRTAKVKVRIGSITGRRGGGTISAIAAPKLGTSSKAKNGICKTVGASWDRDGGEVELELHLGPNARLWDEFTPHLYELQVTLQPENRTLGTDTHSVAFGLRDFEAKGKDFFLNGRKVFLRGTLECCVFPLTGYPPTRVEPWIKLMRAAKAYGLNHLRFHSYCPPKAAFEAADIVGMYLQPEAPFWNTGWASGGVDDENRHLYDYMLLESDRILNAYGNHPCFFTMTAGNEMRLKTDDFAKMVKAWQNKDPRHLYSRVTGGTKYAAGPEADFLSDQARMQRYQDRYPPATDYDYSERTEEWSVPILAHEVGQWCAFPNLGQIEKYKGFFKARNFEIFRDFLAASGQADMAEAFLMASGRFQTLLYKAELEAALRTPGLGGVQLLGLQDFPGQGTALVGVLDAFWDSKGYVTAEEFRKWCSETVILTRMEKQIWTRDETFATYVEIANFGPAALSSAVLDWSLQTGAGQTIASGAFRPLDIPVDRGTVIGCIKVPLEKVPAPVKCVLKTRLKGTEYSNHWDIWVYPAKVTLKPPAGVTVTGCIDDAKEALKGGGKVLLHLGRQAGERKMFFEPIFWNSAWFKTMRGHALGILCDPKHPALAEFPTDSHSNWQWWYICGSSSILELDKLPLEHKPIIQVVPDWHDVHKLALAFEAKVGRGKLLATSIDFDNPAVKNPVMTQMYKSLLSYVNSSAFEPLDDITIAQLESIIKRNREAKE